MKRLYRNGPPAAVLELKKAALSGEFGLDLAARWFGMSKEQATEKFGTYKSGPRKDLIRGYVVWIKVHQGGWVHGRGVVRPGLRVGMVTDNATADLCANKTTTEALAMLPSLPATAFAFAPST